MLVESCKYKFAVVWLIAAVLIVNVNTQSSCTTPNQESGLCVPILTCQTITDLLTKSPRPLPTSVVELVQRSRCGTFNNVHYVCCERNGLSGDGNQPSTTTARTPVQSGGNSKARPSVDKSDAEVKAGMEILEGLKCGKSNADKVAGGEDALLSEFPWMALLVYSDGLDRTLDCGGSLITDRYVLTAAHCIRVGNKRLVSVRLGEHDTTTAPDCVGRGRKRKCAPDIQEIDIEEAIYHKDYNPARFSDDIGLLRLVTRAVFRSNVQPVCLPITPQSRNVELPKMQIAGWGRIESGLKASVLQKATVPVRTNDFCQRIHRVIPITDRQMCAGGENEIDTCKGDSGGPIFFSTRYTLGVRFIQFGVVSAGSSQCGSNFPGIYVRVAAYLDWIAGNLSP